MSKKIKQEKPKRGRRPKPYGQAVKHWYKTLARLRPDIAAAVRGDKRGSVNGIINDELARRYSLPPYQSGGVI